MSWNVGQAGSLRHVPRHRLGERAGSFPASVPSGGILTTVLVRGTLPSCRCRPASPSMLPSRSLTVAELLQASALSYPLGFWTTPAGMGSFVALLAVFAVAGLAALSWWRPDR